MATDKEFTDVADIPEPFKLINWKDYIVFLFGPGMVALGLGVGTGEIISGPYLVVKHGPLILWIALISIFLQTMTSISSTKYTILTGEPVQLGINRLWVGKKTWTVVWTVFRTIQLMWPYYMALVGSTLAAMIIGAPPGPEQRLLWSVLSILGIVICTLPLLVGGKVMTTLARMFFWLNFVLIIPLFFIMALIFVPAETWWFTFKGFFTFGYIPEDADWLAMAAVAGYAGFSSYAGLIISNYYRDVEWGMAKKVGFIPSLVGGKKVAFLVKGFMPRVSTDNIGRAKTWYRYLHMEMWVIFFLFSILTMWFPCALYLHFVPVEAAVEPGFGFAAVLAQHMSAVAGAAWWVVLISLFVIFWPDGTGLIDTLLRELTNIIWNSFPRLYKRFNGDVRPLYYGILAVFTVIWLGLIIAGTKPLIMVLLAGTFANLSGVLYVIGLLGVNYTLLPKEYRFSKFEVVVTCFAIVFYSFFFLIFILNKFFGVTL
jgi:hypothetical protein